MYSSEYGVESAPDAERGYVTTLETPAEASDVTGNAEYPMAYPDQYDDGVLVTRERDDVDGPTLATRAEYFRNLTGVAAEYGSDGVRVGAGTGEDSLLHGVRRLRRTRRP